MAKLIIRGTPELLDGGTVRMHDESDRTFVDVREEDVVGRELLTHEEASPARWLIAVQASTAVTTGELSEREWAALFSVPETRRFAGPGSIRESWCKCTTEGVSHGVCCP